MSEPSAKRGRGAGIAVVAAALGVVGLPGGCSLVGSSLDEFESNPERDAGGGDAPFDGTSGGGGAPSDAREGGPADSPSDTGEDVTEAGGDSDREGGDAGAEGGDAGPPDSAADTAADAPHEGDAACASGLVECGGVCVDTDSNQLHCGDCDQPCAPGQVCTAGQCEIFCPPPQVECSSLCADLGTDALHCGDCATACAPGQVCNGGQCGLVCTGGLVDCLGQCVNRDTDPLHCGGCGVACGPTEECVQGGCQIACESGLSAPVTDPWGVSWDGLERVSGPHATAVSTCAGIGGRLPTASELYRVSATQTAAVGQSFHTNYLWSAVLHDPTRESTVRLSDGGSSSSALTSSLTYRCVCPPVVPPSFSGGNCNGPPSQACFALGGEGGKNQLDLQDRAALSKAGALWECAFNRGHVASLLDLVEGILSGAPNGSGLELRTADDASNSYSTTLKWAGVASGWVVSGNAGVEAFTSQRPFRCAGANYDPGSHPNPVANEFVPAIGGYKGEGADRPLTTWASAHDACWNDGGHLASASEMAELIQAGLPGGSNVYLWSSDEEGYNGTNFLVGVPRWAGVDLRFDNAANYTWGYKTASQTRPFRCIWYPIDTSYAGPSDTDCNGGCFALQLTGATPAKVWVDSFDRVLALPGAGFDACRLAGGHLAGERDLTEAIRRGLPNGSATNLHTSDFGYGGGASAGMRGMVVRWTGVDTAYTDLYSTYMTWSVFTTARPYRCAWTNEIR